MRSLIPAVLALAATTAHAEEGMWPFNLAPVAQVEQGYGFKITQPWLDHAMAASVRFNNGGSGSFVSPEGLVMTNHHVGAECIAELSQKGDVDYMKQGFIAATRADEAKCPALELNQLRSIEDVTDKVKAAEAKAADGPARVAARKEEMGRIEKACADATKLRCDVVTLYGGGAYHLYRYQQYTDVRLVFAPEVDIAFFGGDEMNFTYPRMCLDVSFFRIYQDDKPVATPAYFPLSQKGAEDNQLVFVSGNPGSTGRLDTPAQLESLRDVAYPVLLDTLRRRAEMLRAYMKQGEAQEKAARDTYFGVTNAIKAITGYQSGLVDPELMKAVAARHEEVRAAVKQKVEGERRDALLAAWDAIAGAQKVYREISTRYGVLEGYLGVRGRLADVARTLLRVGVETQKPEGDRLREFRDSHLGSVDLELFSEAPIDPSFEIEQIAFGLAEMEKRLGADDPAVKAALAGQTPRARAEAAVKGTKLIDVAERKRLRTGGATAVDAAKDPMIELMRSFDDAARAVRKRYEDEVQNVERQNVGRIAEAWGLAFGQSVYPDATFTLRLNHGVVKGYALDGKPISWRSTFADLYRVADAKKGVEGYALPPRWAAAKGKLDLAMPFNFVSTNDIIGGNSGSPVFDRDLNAVGLIFDGNIEQLPNRFVYRDAVERSVSVHSAGMLHAIRAVYDAPALVNELNGIKK
ncbi:MAG: S46 family peptidase [Myxococcales bacterium]|nr:S46 family peptidase [Myxococcales bacterium]